MSEQWAAVPGWEGRYEVSDNGRVRSMRRSGVRGGLLKPRRTQDGHLRVALFRDGERRDVGIHVLVLEAFVGPSAPGEEGRHLNDSSGDNRLANLAWGTRADNLADRKRNGILGIAARTHCPRRHLLREPNLVKRRKTRRCLACYRTTALCHYHGQPFDAAMADRKYAEIMGAQR